MTERGDGAGAGPLRVANCSGFYGDRLSAAREMVEGGPIDVLTGDWLAELTMLILAGNRLKGRPGYARTFLTQMEQVLGTCLDRGIKIVTNAGGLDPAGCAEAVAELADRLGLSVTVGHTPAVDPIEGRVRVARRRARIAHVTGDDLMPRLSPASPEPIPAAALVNADTGEPFTGRPVTANAYLGGRPIAVALEQGADVVVTGRVTDAALVTGPGMWWYGWRPGDLDALAGSVVAGHVIECGCQATGGNYAFFEEVPDLARCGFPIAELHADGSSVITKHPGTGGLVSVGTVTAQLLYEIASPRYLGPDVTARFDTIRLEQEGPDRVRISGVRGEPPPDTLKAGINLVGGHRNTMTLVLTGLDIEAKARVAEEAVFARVPRESFERVHVELTPLPDGDAATALLRITVMDPDKEKAGRRFSSAVVETGLASYPGFYALTPPGDAAPYGVFWPALVDAGVVPAVVTVEGRRITVPCLAPADVHRGRHGSLPEAPSFPVPAPAAPGVPVRRAPLGRVAGARSGDKGGNANLGVWATTPEGYAWLAAELTADRLKELLPETRDLTVERFELPNLLALNFVVHGLLGRGVAANPLLDAQAKALGERLRAATVPIPERLLADNRKLPE
ncbi:acyclic terpene utilization AtuA family protein [Microtetraspora malaysiensis]|uniref:acyclic terpene utilization AtuA family protein n=1 Tax=Microtetraspora malaysiensis TaxID=161358 RepID=UPI00083103F1|nr:acyclic terpene utilization AtuA family protein [Microtetraspora malaysiensis]